MQGGLYIHVPFCDRRCPYCDFVLIESDGSLHDAYLVRVIREMEAAAEAHPDFQALTLHFGGGTPSILEPDQISRLIEVLRRSFSLQADAEITLEANPDPADPIRFSNFHRAGITRLSLGVQSFHPRELLLLGRTHTPEQAIQAVEAGLDNTSIDLMFGLPGQTLKDWTENLQTACRLAPRHLSVYGLTYEPGTALTRMRDRGNIRELDESICRAQYEQAMKILPEAGYPQYEISNFAQPGFESRHNRLYWDRRPYLGFGPGAHSFLPEERWWNVSNVRQYLEADNPVWKREQLNADQQRLERIMLGLRRSEGVAVEDSGTIPEMEEAGLVERADRRLRLTRAGRCIADTVIEKFASTGRL